MRRCSMLQTWAWTMGFEYALCPLLTVPPAFTNSYLWVVTWQILLEQFALTALRANDTHFWYIRCGNRALFMYVCVFVCVLQVNQLHSMRNLFTKRMYIYKFTHIWESLWPKYSNSFARESKAPRGIQFKLSFQRTLLWIYKRNRQRSLQLRLVNISCREVIKIFDAP